MDNKKNIRLTFYVVCGLLLGAPYIWRIIKIIPEILAELENAAEILAAAGHTILVIASVAIAYKLGEALWIKIVNIYSMIGLAVSVITMMTRAIGIPKCLRLFLSLSVHLSTESNHLLQ
jgi:signal transduction protein with GAF and PtsI domain